MKNEKREITLNEKDSLHDMLETEKGLLQAYLSYAVLCKRKEVRLQLMSEMQKVMEDVFFLSDILEEKNREGKGN